MLKKIKAVLSSEHGFFARDFRIKKTAGLSTRRFKLLELLGN